VHNCHHVQVALNWTDEKEMSASSVLGAMQI
jgi:hypothetical protein